MHIMDSSNRHPRSIPLDLHRRARVLHNNEMQHHTNSNKCLVHFLKENNNLVVNYYKG